MDQKLENLLNLALETNEAERARTENLNVGFDKAARSWELIVKYSGHLERTDGAGDMGGQRSLDGLEKLGIRVEYLIAGYAILTVPENLVKTVSEWEQIEYVEKPKRYYYSADGAGDLSGAADAMLRYPEGQGPADSGCFSGVTFGPLGLSGEGTLIAVLDSGIDWRRKEFCRADGSTRIRYLWDQTLKGGTPPEGFSVGGEFSKAQIDEALRAATEQEQFERLPSLDASGHGTAVAGIAAGALRERGYIGAAPRAELLIVKLGLPDAMGFPRTTEIMRAVTWALRKADELKKPLVINLSFGNSYGAHDGSSLLERFLDNAAEIGRTVICVGSGNEGASGGHATGNLLAERESAGPNAARPVSVEFSVAQYERSLNVQLWKNYADRYRIILRAPGGQESPLPETVENGKYTLRLEQTEILVYIGEPTPYSVSQEIYLEFLPVGRSYIDSGIWSFRLEPERIVTGRYYFYMPSGTVRNSGTGFFRSVPDVTLTIPSTAAKVITVGAYDPTYDACADFSGRGYADSERTVGVVTAGLAKPDLVAPGVDILAPDIYGGYVPVTGTSFATPIVSGAAALLMEWGIVRGNDPFLYGEKIKAYLRKGARPLRGESVYPNARVGWGKLCVEGSLPG